MKEPLIAPDVERLVRDLLDTLTPAPTTVGIALPADWTPGSSPTHLLVASDGAVTPSHRITSRTLVRITAYARSTTAAKLAAAQAEARLTAHVGAGQIVTIRLAAGQITDRDPATRAERASFAVNVTARSTVLA